MGSKVVSLHDVPDKGQDLPASGKPVIGSPTPGLRPRTVLNVKEKKVSLLGALWNLQDCRPVGFIRKGCLPLTGHNAIVIPSR